MSVSKARMLAKTLRWHHIGFAFLWATTFSALIYPASATAEDILLFKTADLAFVIATVISLALAVRLRRREQPRPRIAFFAGALLSLGAALFYGGFYSEDISVFMLGIAGACIGVASGLFFALWQTFFTSEGASRTVLYIPLSAVASAVLCFALQALPLEGVVACAAVIFPILAATSLHKALSEIEPVERDSASGAHLKTSIRDLWKPVFCVCSIGLIWKITSNLLEETASPMPLVVLAGFAAAALIIALIELFSKRGFEVLRSYQVLFPLITGAFLLPTIFGMQFAPLLSGMLMFGFEIVNLLLIITCAIYANERSIPSTYVYALCMVPTFFAMIAGDMIGVHLVSPFTYDLSFIVGILFLCVYILSVTMFLVSWTRQRKVGKREASETLRDGGQLEGDVAAPKVAVPTPATDTFSIGDFEEAWAASFSEKITALKLLDPLSSREREVAALFVQGNSVAAISARLFISENTVRGHAKSIYRKLDVHSKQQLIDLFRN